MPQFEFNAEDTHRVVEALLYAKEMRLDNAGDVSESDPFHGDEMAEVEAIDRLLTQLDPTGAIQKAADVTDGTPREARVVRAVCARCGADCDACAGAEG